MQWTSLAYQTRRQREIRRADSQRAALLALQDRLGEVDDSVRRAVAVRSQLSFAFEREGRDPDEWGSALLTSDPEMETLRSLTYRLRLLAAGIEHEGLRIAVGDVSRWAFLAPLAPSDQDSREARDRLTKAQIKAVDLLGEQIRTLR